MESKANGSGENWDYVVVGGGSAGCVLAARLSEDREASVLLLDAGRSDRHIYSRLPAAIGQAISNPRMNWQYMAEPDVSRNGRVDMWPAGRMLGGGSSINGMMFVRGHPHDYDDWAQLGNHGWSYDEVLPYFQRLEHSDRLGPVRGRGGPLRVSSVRVAHPLTDAFVAGMQEIGVARSGDLNGSQAEGVDYCEVTQRDGWRESTAQAYVWPASKRANLTVRLGALAERIEVDANGCASGVNYRHAGRLSIATARRGVVICSGAIGSPKLLLQSGIGGGDALRRAGIDTRHELPGVGRNLQEHPGVICSPHVNVPTLTSDSGVTAVAREAWRFLRRRHGALTNPVGHAHALIRTRASADRPNVQIIFSPLAYDHHETGATPYRNPAATLAVGLTKVTSRGEVRLRSAEPGDPPMIEYSLLDDPDDVAQLAEGVEKVRELYSAPAFARLVVDERKPGTHIADRSTLADYIRAESFLMYHPCGTCAMGTGDDAVVDPKLAVRGLRHLYVADASVIPTIPAGNINATVIMIAEYAADLILHSATEVSD